MEIKRFLFGGLLCLLLSVVLSNPMDDEDRLRFAIVDASIYLSYLPSLMSSFGVENLAMATQAFLESKLDLHPTILQDLQVIVDSQTLGGRKTFDNNSTRFVVQANLQILVRYQMLETFEDTNIKYMETRIRSYLTNDEIEVRALLMLLDPESFDSLRFIDLKPRSLNPPGPTTGSEEANSEINKYFSFKGVIIFLVVGAGLFASALTLLVPICCSRTRTKQGSAFETEMSSCTSEATQEPHQILEASRRQPEAALDKELVRVAPIGISVAGDRGTRGHIQGVFSKDKLHQGENANHSSLSELRAQKHHAEGRVREQLHGILHGSIPEDLETGRGCKKETYVTHVRRVSTPSTDHTSDRKSFQQDKQASCHRKNDRSRKPERRSNGKTKRPLPHTTNGRPTQPLNDSASHRAPDDRCAIPTHPDDHLRSPRLPEQSASTNPVLVVSHTNDHDGCSVSTITCTASTFGSEEDRELDVASRGSPSKCSRIDSNTVACAEGSDADDFGSIANSLPSSVYRVQ